MSLTTIQFLFNVQNVKQLSWRCVSNKLHLARAVLNGIWTSTVNKRLTVKNVIQNLQEQTAYSIMTGGFISKLNESRRNLPISVVKMNKLHLALDRTTFQTIQKKETNLTPVSTDSSLDFILDCNFESSTVKTANSDDVNCIDQFLEDIKTNLNNCAGISDLQIKYGDDGLPNLPHKISWKGHLPPCEPYIRKRKDTMGHIKAAIYVCRYISKQQHFSAPLCL